MRSTGIIIFWGIYLIGESIEKGIFRGYIG